MRAVPLLLLALMSLLSGAAAFAGPAPASLPGLVPAGQPAVAEAKEAHVARNDLPRPLKPAANPNSASPTPAGAKSKDTKPADVTSANAKLASAKPAGRVLVRLGNHGDFGRVVLLLPPGAPPGLQAQDRRDGDRLTLSLPGAGDVAMAPVAARSRQAARHVLSVEGSRDQAVLTLDPGSVARIWRMGARIVIDIYGDEAAAAGAPGAVQRGPIATESTATTSGNPPPGRAITRLADRAGSGGAGPGVPGGGPVGAALPDSGRAVDHGNTDAMATGTRVAAGGVAARGGGGVAATDPGTAAKAVGGAAETPAMTAERLAGPAADAPSADVPAADTRFADAGPPADPSAQDDTTALRAVRLAGDTPAILLPFAPRVGAAAFAQGGTGHVVFDDGKAIDLSPLTGDPVFGGARILLLPAATHLTMPVPQSARLALHRRAEGWVLSVEHDRQQDGVAQVRMSHGILSISARQPASSVVLIDAGTGGKLLVGTVHDHGPPMAIAHASPEFALLPSWEGVAVAAASDRLALKVVKNGFALQTATGPPLDAVIADATEQALETGGVLTRKFDFPPLAVPLLLGRLGEDVAAAATAPHQGRFGPRVRAAQDMLALGMDREAAALLKAARQDDPSQASRPDVSALLGIARFLATGDTAAAGAALADPALGSADEVALWRAMVPGQPTPMPARAAVVSADWRLLLSYPSPLQARLLPVAADILIAGNQLAAADALLATDPSPSLDPARARLLQAQGKAAEALAVLDRLAAGPDRKRAAEAVRDATDIRLATHRLSAAQAAHALQKTFYTWREPGFETAQRLRAAALLTDAGDFRAALAQLREADRLFPAAHDRVHAAEQQTVQALIQAGSASRLPALDLVALVDENADLLSEPDVSASLTPVLVDKLMALELPDRAEKLVSRLMNGTAAPGAKAALGAKLASLRLDEGDAPGAIGALDQSDAADLPAAVDDGRAVLRARALVATGQDDAALHVLSAHASDDAWALRAQLLEKAHDWHGAETALQALAVPRLGSCQTLTADQQDLVLRLASAASQAGDSGAIRALQAGCARHLSPGPRRDLFQALATQPVQAVTDLPRSGREADAARALPAALARYDVH